MSKPPPDPSFILRGSPSAVTCMKFIARTSGPPLLLSGTRCGLLCLWDIKLRRIRWKRDAHNGQSVLKVETVQGQSRVLSYGRDGRVLLWTWESDSEKLSLQGSLSVDSLTFCPFALWRKDNTDILIAPSDESTKLNVYKLVDSFHHIGNMLADVKKYGMSMCLKICRDAMFAGYESGDIILWDLNEFKEVSSLNIHSEPVMCLDYNASVNRGVAASTNGQIVVWSKNANSMQNVNQVIVNSPGFNDVAIRFDGKLFISAGWDGSVRVFGLKKCNLLVVLKYHKEGVQCVVFDSEQRLAAGAKDKLISFWDVYKQ